MIVDDIDLKTFASLYFISSGHLGGDFNFKGFCCIILSRIVALPIFSMSWKFVISLPESYQISEIHSYYHRRIKQESDYFAIRSGSEPLCDICMRGGSHFHARRVLAVAPILRLSTTHWDPPRAREGQNNYLFRALFIYLRVYFLICLSGQTVMRYTTQGDKNNHIQTNDIMWLLCKSLISLLYSWLQNWKLQYFSRKVSNYYFFLIFNKSHEKTKTNKYCKCSQRLTAFPSGCCQCCTGWHVSSLPWTWAL